MGSNHLETALAAAAAGISVLPPREDGTKAPLAEGGSWAQWQSQRADEAQIREWYANGRTGVGFVTGAVSGKLELFEFDDMGVYGQFRVAANSAGLRELTQRLEDSYSELTPGGGMHWFYRCSEIGPNTKLARRRLDDSTIKVLIETRGEGGFAVVAPSDGKVHSQGAYRLLRGGVDTIPTITPKEREQLFWIARSFDEMQREQDEDALKIRPAVTPEDLDDSSPGNDFRKRAGWSDILAKHGWQQVFERNGVVYWRRPGKDRGVSATTNYGEYDFFYPFTTSTVFDAERGYNKFAVYAILEHAGDFQAAARMLGQKGYGDQSRPAMVPIKGKAATSPVVTAPEPLSGLEIPPNPTLPDWFEEYIEYASCISPMTPRSFHESAALWLGSVAIARRLAVQMNFGTVYPSLWVLWLAPTTLYRKTTAMHVAKMLAFRLFSHLLASQNVTTEAIISDMAGAEPSNLKDLTQDEQARWRAERNFAAQRGLVLDEASGLLASAGRDYNAGLLEAFLQFYDSFEIYTRSTRSQGRITIHNAYLSMLAASTPTAMAPHLTVEQLWSNGWWPRFALLTPPDDIPDWQEPRPRSEPIALGGYLERLYNRLPTPQWPDAPRARRLRLTPRAEEMWNAYNKALSYDLLRDGLEPRLYGTYGRLPTQVIKVATILAAIDWPEGADAPTVDDYYMRTAMAITERWREGAHRVLATALRTDVDKLWARIARHLALVGDAGITLRDLGKAMRDVQPTALLETLQQMVRVGEVEEQALKREAGGRPTVIYKLVKE